MIITSYRKCTTRGLACKIGVCAWRTIFLLSEVSVHTGGI